MKSVLKLNGQFFAPINVSGGTQLKALSQEIVEKLGLAVSVIDLDKTNDSISFSEYVNNNGMLELVKQTDQLIGAILGKDFSGQDELAEHILSFNKHCLVKQVILHVLNTCIEELKRQPMFGIIPGEMAFICSETKFYGMPDDVFWAVFDDSVFVIPVEGNFLTKSEVASLKGTTILEGAGLIEAGPVDEKYPFIDVEGDKTRIYLDDLISEVFSAGKITKKSISFSVVKKLIASGFDYASANDVKGSFTVPNYQANSILIKCLEAMAETITD